jgi:hypothetical protein
LIPLFRPHQWYSRLYLRVAFDLLAAWSQERAVDRPLIEALIDSHKPAYTGYKLEFTG